MEEKSYFEVATKKDALTRAVIIVIFVIGLLYLFLPDPVSVFDFPQLPHSVKSNLDGDTWQNPNIVAYYSDLRRDGITKFYRDFFSKSLLFGIPVPMIVLNHPPEEAYRYVRDQQESTFLEQYTFPLRGTIFVNGYEPTTANQIHGKDTTETIANTIKYGDSRYKSKTTLRYYPTSVWARLLVYCGIWFAFVWLFKINRKLSV
ncbi:MAG: hypothetical protein Q7R49_04240 [Candidatus Daviesbacteria bacterium]|nr:hypothetical protein [Candidatus Daviesbacteria bacterium]